MATSTQLRREILAGQWDEALCTLYGTESAVLARQRQRYAPRWNSLSFTMAPGGRCMFTRLRAGRSWAATTPITARVWSCGSGDAGSGRSGISQ